MPRNGSGTSSVINTFVIDTVADPDEVNANFTDVADQLTNSLPRDGQAGMNAPLPLQNGTAAAPALTFSSDPDTGFYRYSANKVGLALGGVGFPIDPGVIYAAKSGNYTALSTDNTAVHRYTAAATVTLTAAATLAANWHYTVIADGGAVTIDPNSSETINGQATLVIPNGSSAEIICDGSNFFTVIKPFSWESIGYYTLSAAGSLSITDLGAFRTLRVAGSLLPSAASAGMFIRSSTNNGSSYDSGAANYTNQTLVGSSSSVAASSVTDTALAITRSTLLALSFEAILFNFNSSGNNMHATSRVYTNISPSGVSSENNGGQRTSGTARNAFQIIAGTGGVTLTGAVTLEGIRG